MGRVALLAIIIFIDSPNINTCHTNTGGIPFDEPNIESELLSAIIQVESGGDSTKHAKGEDAVGCLQIRKIMIRDVNRILKRQKNKKKFRYKDRWSCEKSKEIFDIVIEYYLPGACDEDIARLWNGGPRGPVKKNTKKYWRKVLKKLKKAKYEKANS